MKALNLSAQEQIEGDRAYTTAKNSFRDSKKGKLSGNSSINGDVSLLFSEMQSVGVSAPFHSADGKVSPATAAGFAAFYQYIKGLNKLPSQQRENRVETLYQEFAQESRELGIAPVDLKTMTRGQLWRYIPRCTKCGRFLPTQDPVCSNPKCARMGEIQGDPVPWPPAGMSFVKSKVVSKAAPASAGQDPSAAVAESVGAGTPETPLSGDPENELTAEEKQKIEDDRLARELANRRQHSAAQKGGNNYVFTDDDEFSGGQKQRYKYNVTAIRLLNQLDAENRMATPEEQAILAKYTGWGDLAPVFDSRNEPGNYWAMMRGNKTGWEDEYKELKQLLSDEEFKRARAATTNSHYTSKVVIEKMWDALKYMGFDGGYVLDPSMGTGRFFGLIPQGKFNIGGLSGVELDTTTAKIARQLFQKANVQSCGFQDTVLPNNHFDLAISNVPFGDIAVTDKEFLSPVKRFLQKSIHNFFFAKALDKVRPGGVVAFVTSRYTLDAKDSKVRQYLDSQADFLGAVRLPNTAFKGIAGTEVVCDIIYLRKRAPGTPSKDSSWTEVKTQNIAGEEVPVNSYFVDNPDMILGKLSMKGSMYSGNELTVEDDGRDLGQALDAAMLKLPKDELVNGGARCPACQAFVADDGNCTNPKCPTVRGIYTKVSAADVQEGAFVIGQDGMLYLKEKGALKLHRDYKGNDKANDTMVVSRIKAMVEVNLAARNVNRLNVEEAPDEELNEAIKKLNDVYDKFVGQYGPLTSNANRLAMRSDPNYPFLLALEDKYDSQTNTAKKMPVFDGRIVPIRKSVDKVNSSEDALNVVLNENGWVNFARMAALSGRPVDAIQAELLAKGLIFELPDGSVQTADEYLSGNVREKLEDAQAAAALNSAFEANVEALQLALPPDVEPGDINAELGVGWIEPSDIEAFAGHLFNLRSPEDDFEVSYSAPLALWGFRKKKRSRYSWGRHFEDNMVENVSVWGTKRMPALDLIDLTLNGQEATVFDKDDNDKRVLNQQETLVARAMQMKLKEEFKKWIFSDQDRTKRLVEKYNRLFNSEVPREFDGSFLTLPGMGTNMPELHKHQKNAIYRVVHGNNSMLAHVVGAGKTFSMIGASMELKRLGLRNRCMHVVPNHLLKQYAADFYRMYPGANLLVLNSEKVNPQNRGETMARIANGNYDAVIVSQNAFAALPVKAGTEAGFYEEEIEELRQAIELEKAEEDAAGRKPSASFSVKRMEKRLANFEAKLKELNEKASKRDKTIEWEDLGVDQLFVDEADMYKNLYFTTRMTRIPGIGQKPSGRAFDMYVKTRYLQKRYGEGKGICFATGTPVANSISELYVMQKFLDPAGLKSRGVFNFDAWAKQFAKTTTAIEMKPSGSGYRMATRFAQFQNLPELKRLWWRVADVQLDAKALGLKRPSIKPNEDGDSKPRIIAAEATDRLREYIQELDKRAGRLGSVNPREDNMLKITTDGRKAALDMRLIDPKAPDDPNSKINLAVANIADIYKKTTDADLPGVDGKKNLTQLVFCDLGTVSAQGKSKRDSAPSADEPFSPYLDIRAKLINVGVKPEEIAFMQDYTEDEQKIKLFGDVNAGRVRILIGSTGTMGAGTNVQELLVASHHLDAPWRPRDIEQRDGRILRQGNLNPEVEVIRYVTEESFDTYYWQTLERKQGFISQANSKNLNVRSIEDVGEVALDFAQVKAIATGRPEVLEFEGLRARLMDVEAQERDFKNKRYEAELRLTDYPSKKAALQTKIDEANEKVQGVEAIRESLSTADEARQTEISENENFAKDAMKKARELRDQAKKDPSLKQEAEAAMDTAVNAENVVKAQKESYKKDGAFSMTLQGRLYTSKEAAGKALSDIETDLLRGTTGKVEEIGQFMGVPIASYRRNISMCPEYYIKVNGKLVYLCGGGVDRTWGFDNPRDSIRTFMGALDNPTKEFGRLNDELRKLDETVAPLQTLASKAFEKEEELRGMRRRFAELDAIVRGINESAPQQALSTEDEQPEDKDDKESVEQSGSDAD
ncbi:MAG: DEAD/DEAH box helicase family protein [Bacteroidales bacterium]